MGLDAELPNHTEPFNPTKILCFLMFEFSNLQTNLNLQDQFVHI